MDQKTVYFRLLEVLHQKIAQLRLDLIVRLYLLSQLKTRVFLYAPAHIRMVWQTISRIPSNPTASSNIFASVAAIQNATIPVILNSTPTVILNLFQDLSCRNSHQLLLAQFPRVNRAGMIRHSLPIGQKLAAIHLVAAALLISEFFVFPVMQQINAADGINKTINFQGKVVNTNGTNVTNGNYDFTFRIYDAASAGTILWTETWNVGTSQVSVTDGIFRVPLGTYTLLTSDIFEDNSRFLDITFNGETFTTRVRLSAVPYAFNAEKVNGLTVTNTLDAAFNAATYLKIGDGKTVSIANSIALSGTDGDAYILPDVSVSDTILTLAASQILTNKTIGSTGLIFDNTDVSVDITTATNDELRITASGTGDVVFLTDADTTFAISNLANCDSIDTDINGILSCGIDAGASASPFLASGGIIGYTTSTERLRLLIGEVGDIGLEINGIASQTANYLDVKALSTDTEPVFALNKDGKLLFGVGGSTAGDTNLYRSAANALKTDDAFTAVGQISSTGSGGGYGVYRRDNDALAWIMYSQSGTLALYNGGDVLTLTQAGALTLAGKFGAGTTSPQTAVSLASAGVLSWEASAGTLDSPAVNLYRSAASVLKTDASFVLGLPAAGYLLLDGSTTPNNGTSGVLDINVTSATTNNRGIDLNYVFTGIGTATVYGGYSSVQSTQALTTNAISQVIINDYKSVSKTGADTTDGTINLIGQSITASNTGGGIAATRETKALSALATGDANGTTTTYGVYATANNADMNYGGYFKGSHSGAVASAQTTGAWAVGFTDSTATTTLLEGVRVNLDHTGASTATTGYNINVIAPTLGTNAAITTNYGLSIGDMGHVTKVTTSYGLYIAGQSASAAASYAVFIAGDSNASRDGITFGTTNGTNLYKSANATLKTDGSLVIGNGSGNDYLSFTAEGTNPTCSTGNYYIWANSGDTKLKACQNGTTSDLVGAGGGAFLEDVVNSVIYPSTTTYDFILGASTIAASALYFDITDGGTPATSTLYLGTNESKNGKLVFYSSGVAETDPSMFTNATGDLFIHAPSGTLELGDGSGDILLEPVINNAIVNLTGTGDFLIRKNSQTYAAFTETGQITFGVGGVGTDDSVLQLNAGSGAGGIPELQFGTNGIYDVNLYRSAADTLKTDDKFIVGTLAGASATQICIDGSNTIAVCSASGDATTALSNLASVAINTSLISDTDVTDDLGSSAIQWKQVFIGGNQTTNAYGIQFGSTSAVNLYRSAANQLALGSDDQLLASQAGIEFTESDMNPACAAGNFNIFADISENKLKKCQNGTVTDLDTTGGSAPETRSATEITSDVLSTIDTVLLSVSITPTSTANEIWVTAATQINSNANTDDTVTITLIRGTSCGINVLATRTKLISLTAATGVGEGNASFTVTDAPASIGATTYSICGMSAAGNHAVSNKDITVQEVDTTADLAEIYSTADKSVESGDVVTIDSNLNAGVKKTQHAYDSQILGVISTKPALLIGGTNGEGVSGTPVALSGRIPVKVSTENGSIKPGDYLTSSSIPGVAMKAVKAGTVIGQALTGYDDAEIGLVMLFVKNTYAMGDGSVAAPMSYITPNGKLTLSEDREQKEKLLAYFDKNRATYASNTALATITTDRVSAGLEVVTGTLTAEEVVAKQLFSFPMLNLEVVLGENSSFVIKGRNASENAVTIDAFGNATFAGELKAKSIKADTIEGFAMLSQRVSSLSAQVQKSATPSASSQHILEQLSASGALVISKPTEFKGTSIFSEIAVFFKNVILAGDVLFEGRPTFNKDTAGFALIRKGESRVTVGFEKQYASQPIVAASVVLNEQLTEDGTIKDTSADEFRLLNAKYGLLLTRKSTKGFTIVLNKAAEEDMHISWFALAVKDAKTHENPKPIEPNAALLPAMSTTSASAVPTSAPKIAGGNGDTP